MITVTSEEAKDRLEELLDAAKRGEDVRIMTPEGKCVRIQRETETHRAAYQRSRAQDPAS